MGLQGPLAKSAADAFTINTADSPPYSTKMDSGIYDRIVKLVFENLGIKIKINHLPSARSIENVEIGLDDAEYARIKGLADRYKNLVLVDEKLTDFIFTAFAKNAQIRIDGWESLNDFNVSFMRGWKIYEQNVKAPKSLHMVSSESEMYGMLLNDRVDVILYERLRGYDFMRRNNIKGISSLQSPLAVRGMYLYVNKKHQPLVPRIEEALRTVKKNGAYEKILEDFIK